MNLIPPSAYQTIYILLVTVLTIFVMKKYFVFSLYGNYKGFFSTKDLLIPLSFVFILWIGLRPISVQYFTDTGNYYNYYQLYEGNAFIFDWNTENILFDNLFYYVATNHISFILFQVLIAAIYFGGIAFACTKLFSQDRYLAFIVYLGAFSTYSYGTNGIKSGAAASLFLIALAYWRQLLIAAPFLFLSLGFHHSMILPIVAFVIAFFFKKNKIYLFLWIVCLLLAMFHVTSFQLFFSRIVDEKGAEYLDLSIAERIVSGFRLDFTLYSSIPVFIGYYIRNKYQLNSDSYGFMWRLYVLCNSIWLLCTWAAYSNRIAYLSWFLLPIVLLYPFVLLYRERLVNRLPTVVYGHLCFTLFMEFIYYIFIK